MSSTGEKPEPQRKVLRFLRHSGVRCGASVLVAASGGADSTALLCLLAEAHRFDLQLTVVHVYHGLRPRDEGEQDVRFLAALAARLGVELRVERILDGFIMQTTRATGRSVEEVAREMRYQRITKVADDLGVDWIAVAHTQDDQLETILMRLFGGGLLQGLAGIPRKRERIIRPLINCSREEVLWYLHSRKLQYRSDSTNTDQHYLRNRLRKQLLPVVHRLFPSAHSAVETFTKQVSGLNELLDTCTVQMIPWEKAETGYRIAADRFFRAPGELRIRSVLRLFNETGVSARIPRGFLAPLDRAIPHRSGGILLDGFGALIEHRGDWVFWHRQVVLKTKKSYLIRVFEPTMYHIMPTLCFRVNTELSGSASGHGIALPEAFIRPPLVVRSRKPGDAIQMKDGMKSLKKLFNEWAVEESHRECLPVVEDRRGICAVVGSVLGYKDRFRDSAHGVGGLHGKEIVFTFEYSGS